MAKKLFMVGGAKGVGKTRLTMEVASELQIPRIETGDIVRQYLSNPQGLLQDYIMAQILNQKSSTIVSTHYAEGYNGEDKFEFKRGLDKIHLQMINQKFDMSFCLVELGSEELLMRRFADSRRRTLTPEIVSRELEYNQQAYEMYLSEFGATAFILNNIDFEQTKLKLLTWTNERK